MTGFQIVGAYESSELEALPSHVSPIIVEATEAGFRRWHYQILKPYRIKLVRPVGPFRQTLTGLFPVRSYWLVVPMPFADTTQLVAVSGDRILASTSRAKLALLLLAALAQDLNKSVTIARTTITLLNIIR